MSEAARVRAVVVRAQGRDVPTDDPATEAIVAEVLARRAAKREDDDLRAISRAYREADEARRVAIRTAAGLT